MGFFQDRVSQTLPWLASNLDSLDVCLLRSWDYRREPKAPDTLAAFEMEASCYAWVSLDHNLPTHASCVAGIIDRHACPLCISNKYPGLLMDSEAYSLPPSQVPAKAELGGRL
jgi:hypothetical protein